LVRFSTYSGFFDRAAFVLNEAEADEFAAQLIETRSEAQFDHLLGAILTHAAARSGGSLSPMMGSALGGLLKSIARQGLGRQTTARALSLELEGLAGIEREFETALQFVRLVAEAARHAVEEPAIAPSRQAAHAALAAASDIYAPQLTSYLSTDEEPFGSDANLRAISRNAVLQSTGPQPISVWIEPFDYDQRWNISSAVLFDRSAEPLGASHARSERSVPCGTSLAQLAG
jgi:hypothetical protein